MIYFDNAATTYPKPVLVRDRVVMALTCYGANPGRSGHDLSVQTAQQVYGVREKAAAFFGAKDTEHVVFTQNCTHAINLAVHGLLRQGDHVVISDLEHNSVLRPIHALAQDGVITYSVAKTAQNEEETVSAFRKAIRPNTRAFVFTHASNVFGIKLPLRKLAALAHSFGLYVVVDAAQSAGVEEIDVTGMQIDFLCAAGHKSLYGPSGTGLLVTPYGAKLAPLMQGGTGSNSLDYNQPDFMPDRLESGTVNTAGIIGLGGGLEFIEKRGLHAIAKHEMGLVRKIYDELYHLKGTILYTPPPKSSAFVPVLSFNIKGLSSEETTAKLNEAGFALRGGLHCAPLAHKKMGTVDIGAARLSVGAFNTKEEADAFIAAVRQIVYSL